MSKLRNTPTLIVGSGARAIRTECEGPLAKSLIVKGLGGSVKHWRYSAQDERPVSVRERRVADIVTREFTRKWAGS